MQHAFIVSGCETGAQFAGNLHGLIRRESSNASQQRVQIFAIDVFHRKVRKAFHLTDVINAANIGMRDLARDADFVVKARQRFWIAGGFLGQKLKGDRLAKLQICGAIHLPHPARAQKTDDSVSIAEQCAG
jgi:hypothetical protein